MNKYLILGLLGLATVQAEAATQRFCVGTDQALQSALDLAFATANTTGGASTADILLRRRAQAYAMVEPLTTGATKTSFGGLRIMGGYSDDPTDDCTEEGRVVAASNTQIVDMQQDGLRFRIAGDFLLEGLSLVSTSDVRFLHVRTSNRTLEIHRSSIDAGFGLHLVNEDGDDTEIRFINSVVTGNQVSTGCGIAISNPIDADSSGNSEATIANSTIGKNGGDGICLSRLDKFSMQDSIVWDNDGLGIVDRGSGNDTPIALSHNIVQPNVFIPGLDGNHTGGLSSDPLFTDDEMHIALNSPAVNSGDEVSVYDLPAFDLDGNVREQGDRVDRGAFETEIAQIDEIIVNSASDVASPPPGVVTLRKAIVLSNTIAGAQAIHFAVGSPAQCPAIFTLATPLPDITDSVRIDAEKHDDWVPNSSPGGFDANLCAKVRAATLGTVDHAFMVPPGSSASVQVRGFEFDKIVRPIVFNGGKNHVISGNQFGEASQHVTLSEVSGSRIGGVDLSQRNHFSRATQRAVSVRAQDNKVIGNLFGPDSPFDPDVTNRNEVGLEVTRTGNLVQYNRFTKSMDNALQLRGSKTTVRANEFLFNDRAIDVAQFFGLNGTGNDNEISDNLLFGNIEGILLNPKTTGNRLAGNIGSGTAGLGIDLDGNGAVNPNSSSALAPVDAANKAQNYPVLLQAKTIVGEPHQAQVEGQLSARNGTYDVELFADTACHASGHGEGVESVGTRQVTITNASAFSNGNVSFAVIVAGANPTTGLFLSATATDAAGNTSEFGACLEVEAADGGPQPLPDAIFSDGFED